MVPLKSFGDNKLSYGYSEVMFLLRYGTELVLCLGGRKALAFIFTFGGIRILRLVSYWARTNKSSLVLEFIICSDSALGWYSIELLILIGCLE